MYKAVGLNQTVVTNSICVIIVKYHIDVHKNDLYVFCKNFMCHKIFKNCIILNVQYFVFVDFLYNL